MNELFSDCRKCIFRYSLQEDYSTNATYECEFQDRPHKLGMNGATVLKHETYDGKVEVGLCGIQGRKCSYFLHRDNPLVDQFNHDVGALREHVRSESRNKVFAYVKEEDQGTAIFRIQELLGQPVEKVTCATKSDTLVEVARQFFHDKRFSVLKVDENQDVYKEIQKHFTRVRAKNNSYYMEVGAEPLVGAIVHEHNRLIKEECVQAPVMVGGDWCIIQSELFDKVYGFTNADENGNMVHPLQIIRDYARDNNEQRLIYNYYGDA
jgi:hypothetical protein